MAILTLKDIQKSYHEAGEGLHVLRGVDLTIEPGEMVALVGPSGSGKTTLLQIASLLDRPDGGSIVMDGEDMSKANDRKRTLKRRHYLGFVYQFHHLLPEFTALENVAMPLLVDGVSENQAAQQASALLEEVGLAERASHTPDQLSGGEQQRVAVARALVNKPALLIADEPTGNLDPDNASHVFELLVKLCQSHKLSILMATHNMALAKQFSKIVMLSSGKLT